MRIRKTNASIGRVRAALATAALVLLSAPHEAGALTINFSGPLDTIEIFGPASGLWTGIAPGTVGTLTVDFNLAGTDLSGNPNIFVSQTSINSAVLNLGPHSLLFGSGSVSVVNDLGGIDQFALNLNPVDQLPVASSGFQGLQFLFSDTSGAAFSSASLEQALAAIIGQNGVLDLSGPGNGAHGTFSVSAASVPDAGHTGFLLVGTLTFIAVLRRRLTMTQ